MTAQQTKAESVTCTSLQHSRLANLRLDRFGAADITLSKIIAINNTNCNFNYIPFLQADGKPLNEQ